MSDTPRTKAATHNIGSVMKPHYVVDEDIAAQLEHELNTLRASQSEAVQRDAERYRWLRDTKPWLSDLSLALNVSGPQFWDAAIDAARSRSVRPTDTEGK